MPLRTIALGLVLLLALAACTRSPDAQESAASGTPAPTAAPAPDSATEPEPATGPESATELAPVPTASETAGSGTTSRSTSTAGTTLQRAGDDAATDLERRITEVLTDLGAERRGADTVITLPDRVLFDFDEDTLRPDAAAVLDDLVEVIAYFEDAPVLVHGHTDSIGSAAYNEGLSERRAEAVVAHFTSAGVRGDRITAEGFGFTRPVAPNTTPEGEDDPEGRAQNRRVEIVLEGVDPADLQR